MDIWTFQEVADKLGVIYSKIYYMVNSAGFCQNEGESIKSATGSANFITDKGVQVLADYIEAEKRMYARRPKSPDQIAAEKQKKAMAEMTKKVMDALPQQELNLVQQELANIKLCGNVKGPRYTELKRKEAALLKRLSE